MFLICRKGDGPLVILANGPCEEFVKSFLKYNVSRKELNNLRILKTEETDINQFLDVEIPLE
jgi:hypothetical protein